MYRLTQTNLLADMLLQRFPFRKPSIGQICKGADYRLYSQVPVSCLIFQPLNRVLANTSHLTIDLLICRGNEALYAVIFDAHEYDEDFSRLIRGITFRYVKTAEMNEETAAELCDEIEHFLCSGADVPNPLRWKLYALSLKVAAKRMGEPAVLEAVRTEGVDYLRRKHLVSTSGRITPYGRSCGLFRVHTGRRTFSVSARSVEELHSALQWNDPAGENRDLSSRLSRIRQGLPTEGTGHSATLCKLLSMPLEEFYRHHPRDLQHLYTLLSRAQFLSFSSKVSAFGDREEIRTYADVLYVVYNLWEYTAHRSSTQTEVTQLCEDILMYLSFPLWSEPEIKSAPSANAAGADLNQRLEQVRPDIFRTPLSVMPLQHYFHGAACITGSGYPLWLAQHCVNPHLEYYGCTEPTCVQALTAVYNLSQSEDAAHRSDCFPLIYDILVEPFVGIL